MNDIIDFLKTRCSPRPRDLTGPGPSAEEIDTILTIASRVPDHGKLAPWRFLVFEGEARARGGEIIAKAFIRTKPDATEAEIAAERGRLSLAPLVIGVVSRPQTHPWAPEWEQQMSAAASAMNIVLAATALGYGACWLTGWVAGNREVLDGFGLKPEEKMIGMIYIGSVATPPVDRPRPALSEVVTRF